MYNLGKKVFRQRLTHGEKDSTSVPRANAYHSETILGPGDSYYAPDTLEPESGRDQATVTALHTPCWAISLPDQKSDGARDLLFLLERKLMGDRLLARGTWKFK